MNGQLSGLTTGIKVVPDFESTHQARRKMSGTSLCAE